MKKLALVLGSLLVVGAVASAKEVVPAPVAAPEVVERIVEKPVIVYRDREVTPAWRPSGSVDVALRYEGETENQNGKDLNKGWGGKEERARFRTVTNINFTENQSLKIETRNFHGLKSGNNDSVSENRFDVVHNYRFGKIFGDVTGRLETAYRRRPGNNFKEQVGTKFVFDFADYFFKNDFIKANAIEIGPSYTYRWNGSQDDYANQLGLYANFDFTLPYGVYLTATFDDAENEGGLFGFVRGTKGNAVKGDRKAYVGYGEIVLGKTFDLYKANRHNVFFNIEAEYDFHYAFSKGDADIDLAGTERQSGRKQRLGDYWAGLTTAIGYEFKATDYVTLRALAEGVYGNTNEARDTANYWRWKPRFTVGAKVTF